VILRIKELLEQSVAFGGHKITLSGVMLFVLTILITWLLVKFLKRFLHNVLANRDLERGKQYSVIRLFSYLLYVIGLLIGLQLMGLPLQGLALAGSALLIGVGIGLQQIFYDLFSGLVLLFEGKVRVGNVIDINGIVGRVNEINLRTSRLVTLDNIGVVIPNSKLISENVINWSSSAGVARFHVPVGVSYDSNVALVNRVLVDCAEKHNKVLDYPKPSVFLKSFGSNALEFELLFWTNRFAEIENIKSEIHFSIEEAFSSNNITIAYPQMDVHLQEKSNPPHAG